MVVLNFVGYIVFGKGDSNSYITEYEVTEEEYKKILESYKSQKFIHMEDDQSLSDICRKIYNKAGEVDMAELKSDEDYLNDLMSDYLDLDPEDEEFDYSDEDIQDMMESFWRRVVDYPEEFEELEEDI